MSIKDITQKLEDIKTLEAMKAELETEMESLKDEIKAEMQERDIDELQAGIFKVRYKEVRSNRFDSARMKVENPAIYESYLRPVVSRRFTIA